LDAVAGAAKGGGIMGNKTIEPTPIPAYPVFGRFSLCGCDNSLKCKEDCIWYDEEPDMGAHIPFCKSKNKFSLNPEDCQNCDRYTTKYKKTSISTSEMSITNCDKLRAMTDEEFGRFLGKYGTCPPNKDDIECRLLGCGYCWERWLKEEAKNDG